MTTSSQKSTPPSEAQNSYFGVKEHRRLIYALMAFAPVGLADASYLTAEHYMNRIPPCTITHGCAAVATSSYSQIFGLPVALLGAIYYSAVLIGLVYSLQSRDVRALKAVSAVTAVGFAFSAWLVYLQLFVIRAICQWCMVSAATSTLLFVFGILVLKSQRSYERARQENQPA